MSPTIVPATDGRIGVLLINLGVPDTEYRSVRRYLKEFLSDGHVRGEPHHYSPPGQIDIISGPCPDNL
jgi:protoheme ferro-lyase